MIKLAAPTEPAWLALPYGVRVRVRPLTAVLMETARQIAAAEVRELRSAIAKVKDAGGDPIGIPNLDDPAVASAEGLVRVAKALGRVAIIDWEGVLGADDQPLQPTPDAIGKLLDVPSVCSDWFDRYTSTLDVLAAEKNG